MSAPALTDSTPLGRCLGRCRGRCLALICERGKMRAHLSSSTAYEPDFWSAAGGSIIISEHDLAGRSRARQGQAPAGGAGPPQRAAPDGVLGAAHRPFERLHLSGGGEQRWGSSGGGAALACRAGTGPAPPVSRGGVREGARAPARRRAARPRTRGRGRGPAVSRGRREGCEHTRRGLGACVMAPSAECGRAMAIGRVLQSATRGTLPRVPHLWVISGNLG